MEENKISPSYIMNKLTLKDIYKSFGIKYDLRNARNLLNLPHGTRQQVNSALRALYQQIKDETDAESQWSLHGLGNSNSCIEYN